MEIYLIYTIAPEHNNITQSDIFSDHYALNKIQDKHCLYKSTETALTFIVNDLLQSKTHRAHLVLLDLPAEFDTLDHIILINRLYDIGIIVDPTY